MISNDNNNSSLRQGRQNSGSSSSGSLTISAQNNLHFAQDPPNIAAAGQADMTDNNSSSCRGTRYPARVRIKVRREHCIRMLT